MMSTILKTGALAAALLAAGAAHALPFSFLNGTPDTPTPTSPPPFNFLNGPAVDADVGATPPDRVQRRVYVRHQDWFW